MTTRYGSNRFSMLLLFMFIIVVSIAAFLLLDSPQNALLWILLVFSLILYANFYSMRLTVDDDWIVVSYGIGMIVYAGEISSIRSVSLVPNTFLGPWWYNPKATEVIRVEMRDGRRIICESDRAVSLIEMLRARSE